LNVPPTKAGFEVQRFLLTQACNQSKALTVWPAQTQVEQQAVQLQQQHI
jgi:hypothetical protein